MKKKVKVGERVEKYSVADMDEEFGHTKNVHAVHGWLLEKPGLVCWGKSRGILGSKKVLPQGVTFGLWLGEK
ncbi:hypothetical protein HanRHA438_Chr13g0595301 [Helianthus annuus]|nr:hypothetical protein HanRHA438_Chr13g0595301 [Helianthus annuus]